MASCPAGNAEKASPADVASRVSDDPLSHPDSNLNLVSGPAVDWQVRRSPCGCGVTGVQESSLDSNTSLTKRRASSRVCLRTHSGSSSEFREQTRDGRGRRMG